MNMVAPVARRNSAQWPSMASISPWAMVFSLPWMMPPATSIRRWMIRDSAVALARKSSGSPPPTSAPRREPLDAGHDEPVDLIHGRVERFAVAPRHMIVRLDREFPVRDGAGAE